MSKSIAGDAAKLTSVKLCTTVLTMLTAMLLSRFRTLEEYGTYSQLQLVTNLASTIFMIGLPNSINYFLAKAEKKEEEKKFLSNYYVLTTALGCIAGVLLVCFIPFIEIYFKNTSIHDFWFYLMLYPWTKIILAGVENLLVVYKKLTKLIVFKILYSSITLTIVLIAWIIDIDFEIYMVLFMMTEVLFSIWVYGISNHLARGLKVSFKKEEITAIFRFSLPLGLASIVGTISIELDKLLIGYLYNTEELAIYTNASKEMPVTIVATSITAVLMPQLVRMLKNKENEKAISLWDKATRLSYIFIAFCASALIVFAPDIISLLYSEKYLPGVPVFRIYSAVLLLRVTYFGMILNSMGKTKFIFVTSLMSLGLNVVLNFVCYASFGFIGPAVATFVSIVIVVYLQLKYTAKNVKIPFGKMFSWKELFFITVLNIGLGSLVYMFKYKFDINIISNSLLESIFIGCVWGIVYLFLMRKRIMRLWKSLGSDG